MNQDNQPVDEPYVPEYVAFVPQNSVSTTSSRISPCSQEVESSSTDPANRKLYVHGLHWDAADPLYVFQEFLQYGHIEELTFVRLYMSQRIEASVLYNDVQSAERAMAAPPRISSRPAMWWHLATDPACHRRARVIPIFYKGFATRVLWRNVVGCKPQRQDTGENGNFNAAAIRRKGRTTRRHAEWDEQIRRHQAERVKQSRQHKAELARQREADRTQQQHQQQEVIILHYDDALDMGELIQQDEITTSSLSEEVISRNLKTRNPDSEIIRDDGDPKICTVCQDNLRDDDRTKMIAVLDCGHEYHSCCIKKWLQGKNICPLCKRIAIKL
ncbi:hypothetical protein DH2020_048014 [Rehmannia glutinosa]|uniref:RING-type E3 ubiquitin transferase n=1 Tax=Rehmannia glutinosa TaxID=99300 RepID=A0ABR0U6U2_REHGL